MDVDVDTLPSKRRRTQSTIASSNPISTVSQLSHKPRNSPSIHDDGAELLGTSKDKGAQRLHDKSTGRRNPQAAETTTAEVRELKAELAKARADAAAAVALAAEREPSGFGGSIDRLRSRGYSLLCYECEEGRILLTFLFFS